MKTITSISAGRWHVGRVALRSTRTFEQHYEFARWFQSVKCEPQIAELRFVPVGDGGHPTLYATFEGKVTASNFQPCFGGVPIGTGGIDENVGQNASYTVAWEAEFQLGALLSRSDFTYAFDIDLDGLDIQWHPWKSDGYKPGDILYREDKPWDNLPTTGLRADITPLDRAYVAGKLWQAVQTLKDYAKDPNPRFHEHWTRRRDHMSALLDAMNALEFPKEA